MTFEPTALVGVLRMSRALTPTEQQLLRRMIGVVNRDVAAVSPGYSGYCVKCQASLLACGRKCLDCGQPFDPNDPRTFRGRQTFLRWNFWFPGFSLAVVSGILSYGFCLTNGSDLGLALFVAVPVSAGSILGYSTRLGWFGTAFLGVLSIPAIVFGLMTLDLVGFFCGLTLGGIFSLPLLVGIGVGTLLREWLKGTRWNQRHFLPLVALAALPHAVQGVENALPRRIELATVRTELRVDATMDQAFRAIMFYEQVEHDPPWLLKLALPKPIRSEGSKAAAGNLVSCYYDRGYLVKRISERVENRRLAFEVVEQHLHFERDITLLDGSFAVESLDGTQRGDTRIVVSTRYRRRLYPRWLWEPMERTIVHTLHGHVLEGMRRKIDQDHEHAPADSPYEPDPADTQPRLIAVTR
jgi:hypothetical protein